VVSDEGDLRAFLDGPYHRVLRTVTLAAESAAEAQDAVHEAVARGWERRRQIDHFDRWVLSVALNLVRSRWRRLLRAQRAPTPATAASDDLATVECLSVLSHLPPRQRQVAVLRYIEDLSVADIAEILRSTPGAVKNALFHARRALAAELAIDLVEETTE
jgi:RNA polymerase sigma-70 factor (ECF subfamily)